MGTAKRPVVFIGSKSEGCPSYPFSAAREIVPVLPADNRDLWSFFRSMAKGTDLQFAQVHWIKGHMNHRAVSGVDKIHAWINHWADQAAKQALKGHFLPLYQHVSRDFRKKLQLARDLFSFQAGVAMPFANDKDAPVVREPVAFSSIRLVGPPGFAAVGLSPRPCMFVN